MLREESYNEILGPEESVLSCATLSFPYFLLSIISYIATVLKPN